MTREQIEQMPAGREMDTLIAEKVMGFTEYPHDFQRDGEECQRCSAWLDQGSLHGPKSCSVPPHYSIDIAAAWSVVEKLHPKYPIVLTFHPALKKYWVMFPDNSKHPTGQCAHGPNCVAQGYGETPMLAICRAALLTTLEAE